MPTFPVALPKSLGLGALGGGTQAPALVQGIGLVVDPNDSPATAPWLYPYSDADPTTLTGQVPTSEIYGMGTYAGQRYIANDAGVPVLWWDNTGIVAPVTSSLILAGNGAVGAPSFAFTNSATTGFYRSAADTIGIAVGGALDFSISANTLSVLTGSNVILADSCPLYIGTGAAGVGDIAWSWDGTRCNVTQLTVDSEIRWGIDGAGIDQRWYGDTASAIMLWDQSQDARIMSGAAVDLYTQGGSGTGVVIEVIGVDLTHGIKTSCYSATVSPAAVETALFTVPAQSVIESSQASVVSALTGGGTTTTFSIGITGDVDLYGTATTAGVQANLLTLDAKLDCFGSRSANAGAGIGLYVAATQSIKLIAAANGGATAGDTALTAGSVKIRIVYRTMMSLANGA